MIGASYITHRSFYLTHARTGANLGLVIEEVHLRDGYDVGAAPRSVPSSLTIPTSTREEDVFSSMVLRILPSWRTEMVARKKAVIISTSCLIVLLLMVPVAAGHDVITTKITFDREIIRLFDAHCNTCHREGGSAFSLATYQEARPWAKAIGEETLQRRMPPWGAVKGFGDFRNDQGLTPEQLELIVDWEEGGAPEGEPKDLPVSEARFPESGLAIRPADEILVRGEVTLRDPVRLGGLWLNQAADGTSFQLTAELPDGSVYPLLWIQNYQMKFNHPFILRTPLDLPTGTALRGLPATVGLGLIPAADIPPAPKPPVRSMPQNMTSLK